MSYFPTVRLGEVCERVSVGHVGTTSPYYRENGIPFLRTQNVGVKQLLLDDIKFITQDFHNKLKKSQVRSGDVLISRVISNTVNCAVVSEDIGEANCANVILVRPGPKLDAHFLKHFIASPENQSNLLSNRVGSAQSVVNTSVLKGWEIPLPSLPEQKRIAAILDKADSIRRKRQEAVRLTEELLRSVFLDMFGDPVENAKNWPLMPMDTAIQAIETGWSANSEDRPREAGEWAVLKISSVTSGRFLPEEYKVVADGQIDRELLTPKRGDLLFSRANTRELVAATCLVERAEPKLFLPDKLWKIIPDEKITCTEYLRYLLAHPRFREKLTKQATGTSGSMLNISQAKVRGIGMPVPPIKLQKQFAAVVWRNYDIRSKLEAASQSSNTLFYSLLQRSFSGEL